MKKTIKKVAAFILCAVMLLTAVPVAAFAAEERTAVDGGFCGAQGENLTWTLYDDGNLVISGEGEMENYRLLEKPAPWKTHRQQTKVITVEEGVTSLGYDAFSMNSSSYYKIYLPESLRSFCEFSIVNSNYCHMLAIVYAGTAAQWDEVEMKKYDLSVPYADEGWFEEAYSESVKNTDLDYENEFRFTRMFFGGEEPEVMCKLYSAKEPMGFTGKEFKIYPHYYLGETQAEKIIWYGTFDGESEKMHLHEGKPGSGACEMTVAVAPADYGDLYVHFEIVGADGNVICISDEIAVCNKSNYPDPEPPDDRTLLEKIEDTVKGIIGYASFAGFWFFYIGLGCLAGIVALPVGLPVSIYYWISEEFF